MTTIKKKILPYITNYNGPCLIYDLASLKKKMRFFANAGANSNIKFLFTLKSFPCKEAIEIAADIMPGFEVSNFNEYALLPNNSKKPYLSINDPTGQLNANLPKKMIQNNYCYVNLNYSTLETLKLLPHIENVSYGIRVAHTSLPINSRPYPRGVSKSRFGNSLSDLKTFKDFFAAKKIQGINLHNGSEKNTLDTYSHMLDEMVYYLKKENISLSFINLGGGLHNLAEREIEKLTTIIDKKLHKSKIQCFFEPGQIVAKESGYALAKILFIKKINERKYSVITDISSKCHLEWSDPCLLNEKQVTSSTSSHTVKVSIGGPTCYEHDHIGTFDVLCKKNTPPFKTGEIITLANINGYSAAWNISFNGISSAKIAFV